MRSVVHGMRRRLSLPLFIGTFVIAAFMASTSQASANEVVIGLPATPPPFGFDFSAPEDDTPDPPAPDQPFDFTDGDGGDPNPPVPPGPDDFVDGDGGEPDPTPPTGPDDFTDGDGGEGTPTPDGPDDVIDGDGGEGTPTPDGPDDVTDADPDPQDPGDTGDVPADDEVAFEPTADPVGPQTFDVAVPVASVNALPVTGAGNGIGQDHAGLAPVFVLLSAACLLATRLLPTNPGTGSHARNR